MGKRIREGKGGMHPAVKSAYLRILKLFKIHEVKLGLPPSPPPPHKNKVSQLEISGLSGLELLTPFRN
jgi:hypothetical protein